MSSSFVQDSLIVAGSNNFASQEAEEGILAAVCSGDDKLWVLGEVSEADFFYADHQKLFRAMQVASVERKHVDFITVDEVLGKMFPSEQSELLKVMLGTVTGAANVWHVDDYIEIVRELSFRRHSIQAIDAIAASLRDPMTDIGEVLERMRSESNRAPVRKHKWETMTDIAMATFDYLEKRSKGEITAITTGVSNVDALVGGFFGGELTVIGARPSVGKSAFGANIAIEAAKKGYKVGVVSREMTNVQFGQRMFSREGFVSGTKLRNADLEEEDWLSIAECLGRLTTLPITFTLSVKTVEELRSEVQRRTEAGEMDMLIVDYLQLMGTQRKFKDEHLRVGYISKHLKDMAVDFNIPVIALAQVNRETDGQMPTLKSLRASGDIEQDADGVIFLHRPSSDSDPYVDPRDREYFSMYERQELTYICIGVAKQRQGQIGKACVLFDAAHMRYLPIDRGAEE